MISQIISYAQKRLAARREYRRAIAEIETMTNQELIELGAFQSDLYEAARSAYLSNKA